VWARNITVAISDPWYNRYREKMMEEEEREKERELLLEKARIIADYQFGRGSGAVLFTDNVEFILSRTRRIAQIKEGDERIATLRSIDGLFTLGIEGAERLHQHLPYPRLRVAMNEESCEFVRKGETAFCKHVLDADLAIRAYDEVIVVDEQDRLLATGRAMLAGEELHRFTHGVAVKVRHGIEK
jgi:predicted RNA-binding protein (TIGR00451 family)